MYKEIITSYQRGKDYALRYYFRYFPSINRLRQKLSEKTLNNHELIDQIFNDIGHLLNDLNVLETKVQNLLFRNKNKNYIISSLIQKNFHKNEIITTLETYTEQGKSYLNKNFIERKVIQLKSKNKSRQYIKNKLIEQPEDKEIVENILNDVFGDSGDDPALINEYEKLASKNIEQKKIIQRLLSRGFKYNEINKISHNNIP